jgi:hypothetical protein
MHRAEETGGIRSSFPSTDRGPCEHVATPRPQRHPYADLVRPLRHHIRNHSEQPNRRHHHRQDQRARRCRSMALEGDQSLLPTGRLGFSEPSGPRTAALLVRYRDVEGDQASGSAGRNSQESWVAYAPPQLLESSDREGENVKVVQELMRHASSRFTLDVYSQRA